jgi:hypothetical protein
MGLASFSAASSWARFSLYLRLGDSFVGLNRIDLLLYLIWWLGKGRGLLVDAGKDDGDIRRDVVVFVVGALVSHPQLARPFLSWASARPVGHAVTALTPGARTPRSLVR